MKYYTLIEGNVIQYKLICKSVDELLRSQEYTFGMYKHDLVKEGFKIAELEITVTSVLEIL